MSKVKKVIAGVLISLTMLILADAACAGCKETSKKDMKTIRPQSGSCDNGAAWVVSKRGVITVTCNGYKQVSSGNTYYNEVDGYFVAFHVDGAQIFRSCDEINSTWEDTWSVQICTASYSAKCTQQFLD